MAKKQAKKTSVKKKSVAKKAPVARTDPKNVRKLQKQHNGSTTIALPVPALKELKWRDKQKVIVKRRGNTIVIEDWVPPKSR